jgi:hypothetical protein
MSANGDIGDFERSFVCRRSSQKPDPFFGPIYVFKINFIDYLEAIVRDRVLPAFFVFLLATSGRGQCASRHSNIKAGTLRFVTKRAR